jgi:methyltransferase, FkbM family
MKKVRVALTPRSWFLTHRLSNGAIVMGKNRKGYGGRGIYIFGDSIESELEHLEELLGPEGVFIDAGASTGAYTLKAAKHYGPRGIVIAVEPHIELLSTLQHSVEVNQLTNVRLRNLGLARETGERTFRVNLGHPHDFSLVHDDPTSQGFSVLTVSLDDLFKWERLDRLDYLKIDVVGAEEEVFLGGMRTIQSCRPIVQIEAKERGDVPFTAPDYVAFKAEGSPNKLLIPKEHPKIDLPRKLGWSDYVP